MVKWVSIRWLVTMKEIHCMKSLRLPQQASHKHLRNGYFHSGVPYQTICGDASVVAHLFQVVALNDDQCHYQAYLHNSSCKRER